MFRYENFVIVSISECLDSIDITNPFLISQHLVDWIFLILSTISFGPVFSELYGIIPSNNETARLTKIYQI